MLPLAKVISEQLVSIENAYLESQLLQQCMSFHYIQKGESLKQALSTPKIHTFSLFVVREDYQIFLNRLQCLNTYVDIAEEDKEACTRVIQAIVIILDLLPPFQKQLLQVN